MRVDLYSAIHKAQRYHLFQLANEIGKTNFADDAATRRIDGSVREIIEHLRDHARNEAAYIHPLFHQLGEQDELFDDAHHQLEAQLGKIESVLTEKRWSELYRRFNRFLGTYLLHLDEEERAQADVLWPRYSDDELLATFHRFLAERPPLLAKADMDFMKGTGS